jgi:L-lactate dehydrogenase complex protein LldE
MGRAFAGYDYVVTPSGSCAAMVRDNYPRIGAKAAAEGRGGELADVAGALVPRVYELTEFLVDVLGVEDVGAYFPHTVTYHPSCHGLRMLGLGDRPRRLLEAVKGLELRELPGAEECCGFGGTFAVKNPDVSAAMGADKVRNALATGAEVLCGADNSCLLHIDGTLRRQGAAMRAVHLAEILASTETELFA